MDAEKVIPVVIGGLVTLAVTYVVQRYVIPRVQAHNRRIERWEKDVLELSALLEEELPRALDGYKSAAVQLRYTKSWVGDEQYDQEKVQELRQSATAELREARKVVGERMARLKILDSRIERLRNKAPYWRRLFAHRARLQLALYVIELPPLEGPSPLDDDEHREKAWEDLGSAREAFISTLNEIADSTKPPPRQLVYRVRENIRERIKKRRALMSRLFHRGRSETTLSAALARVSSIRRGHVR